MDDAATTEVQPQVPWLLGALILLGAISIGQSIQDEAWAVVAVTGTGVAGLAVVLALVLRLRHRQRFNRHG